ncbi:MAG TPA: type II secretion system F family protein [Candidatus Paceibacterota bacterium]
MRFSYTAIGADGKEYQATAEAADRFVLYKDLHSQGIAVVSAHEEGSKGAAKRFLSISLGGVKATEKIMFVKNLSAMLKAGLPLARAITVLERQMTSREWKKIFTSIQDNLAKGVSLSQSMAAFPKAFSALVVSMVAAGEESGSLAQSLSIVGEELEKSYELKRKVRGALLYPAIIITLMLAIGALMFVYVLPKLTATFKDFNVELPLTTRLIIASSDYFQAHWLMIILAVVAIVVAFIVFFRSSVGKRFFDKLVLKFPVIGKIAIEVNCARATRTLSSLLSSGVDAVAAIKIASDVVQNVHYKSMLSGVSVDIQKGSTLESLFSNRPDLYPPFVGEMIGVGEETGTLSKSLLEVAVFYENEVTEKTKDLSTVIEPLLMIVIGVGVGFFALAMVSPIYSLSEKI